MFFKKLEKNLTISLLLNLFIFPAKFIRRRKKKDGFFSALFSAFKTSSVMNFSASILENWPRPKILINVLERTQILFIFYFIFLLPTKLEREKKSFFFIALFCFWFCDDFSLGIWRINLNPESKSIFFKNSNGRNKISASYFLFLFG